MLNVNKINVFYGEDLQAIWDVSFSVEKKEIVTIIGSNGAGKTTILRTISGLLHPHPGSISFIGERIDKLPPDRIVELGIAQVPEGRHLFPRMTTMENLMLGAYTKDARRKRDDSLEWIFTLFPILKERRKQLAGTLSGGEQQMLAVCRGLMSRPRLLMLDEPSLGLAPRLVLMVLDMIKRINKEGITVLLVEQNVRHALGLTNRGYVLEAGKMVLTGSAEELMRNEHIKKAYLGM